MIFGLRVSRHLLLTARSWTRSFSRVRFRILNLPFNCPPLLLRLGKPLHTEGLFSSHLFQKTAYFLYNKTNICTNFPNLFWLKNEPLHISVSSSAHHQEFMHCTLGTGICHTGLKTAFRAGPGWPCSKSVFQPVWHTPVPCVQCMNSWWWAEKLPETCRGSFLATINLGN